jgi:phospholipase C
LLDLHAQQIPRTVHWNLHISGNWFDFAMTLPSWHRRYADRLETGRDGVTDPALGIGMRSL